MYNENAHHPSFRTVSKLTDDREPVAVTAQTRVMEQTESDRTVSFHSVNPSVSCIRATNRGPDENEQPNPIPPIRKVRQHLSFARKRPALRRKIRNKHQTILAADTVSLTIDGPTYRL